MKLSVIILTINAERYLPGLLGRLFSQTVKPLEIICIDSSSKDNTVSLARKHGAKTIIIPQSSFGHGKTRNLGIRHAQGDTLVFIVQDAIPINEYLLEKLTEPLTQNNIVASYARQLPRENAVPTEKFARGFNYPDCRIIKDRNDMPHPGIKTFFFSNVCSAVRKRELSDLEGFIEKTVLSEDLLLAARLIRKGYRIAYVPEALVIHSHNYDYLQQLRRYFDIGASFNINKELMENVKTESEGATFVKGQIKYLWKNKLFHWIPYAIGEAIVKYIGYQLGLRQAKIPLGLKKALSMHSYYWTGK